LRSNFAKCKYVFSQISRSNLVIDVDTLA
jgi:hypothetical protein